MLNPHCGENDYQRSLVIFIGVGTLGNCQQNMSNSLNLPIPDMPGISKFDRFFVAIKIAGENCSRSGGQTWRFSPTTLTLIRQW